MISLAIVGSRNYTNWRQFQELVQQSLMSWNISVEDLSEVVSGGARGADALAKRFAKENSITLVEYYPDWNTYGKRAGPIRNRKIIDNATHVIAFPSRSGRGTQSSMKMARDAHLPLETHYID